MTSATMFTSDKGDMRFSLALINNLAATGAPAVTNDSASGYQVGSVWINVSTGAIYTCVDPTVGAAVWNVAGDSDAVKLTGNQTIAGVKTFSSAPIMSGASIGAATIPNAALAANGGLASLIGAGLGASKSYTSTATGADTLLASTSNGRSVIIVVVIDATFANNTGTQPTFQIGQTGTAAKFADTTAFTGATAGTVKTFAGVLTGTDNLLVTGIPAVGNGAGGLTVTVLALAS